MAKVDKIEIEIENGVDISEEDKYISLNSHILHLDDIDGNQQEKNSTFIARIEVFSYIHSLTLLGPSAGEWEIKRISVTTYLSGRDTPWKVEFKGVRLNPKNHVNLFITPAPESIDV